MKGILQITNIVIAQKSSVVWRYVTITQRHTTIVFTAESTQNKNKHDAIFHTVRTQSKIWQENYLVEYTLKTPSPSPYHPATDSRSGRPGAQASLRPAETRNKILWSNEFSHCCHSHPGASSLSRDPVCLMSDVFVLVKHEYLNV